MRSILSLFFSFLNRYNNSNQDVKKFEYVQYVAMEISNAQTIRPFKSPKKQTILSSKPSCAEKAINFLKNTDTNHNHSLWDYPPNNTELFIVRVFEASQKPYPIKQPCIVVDNYSFLEFLTPMLSLSNFYNLKIFEEENQYPKEYSFEIFPEHEFQNFPSQIAIQQLHRVHHLLTKESFRLTIPVILGNSFLLDMLQDYLNQCAKKPEDQNEFCKSLISVNGCSSEVTIHRSKLIILIIHKKHFDIQSENPIPAPAKDRLPLIPVDRIESINCVFQGFTEEYQKDLDSMKMEPQNLDISEFIKSNVHPLLLISNLKSDFHQYKEQLTGLYAVIITSSSIYQPIAIENEFTYSVIISTITNQEKFLNGLHKFVLSNQTILLLKFDKFDSIQDQHLKFLVSSTIPCTLR